MAQANFDGRKDKLVATRNEAFHHARNCPVSPGRNAHGSGHFCPIFTSRVTSSIINICVEAGTTVAPNASMMGTAGS